MASVHQMLSVPTSLNLPLMALLNTMIVTGKHLTGTPTAELETFGDQVQMESGLDLVREAAVE